MDSPINIQTLQLKKERREVMAFLKRPRQAACYNFDNSPSLKDQNIKLQCIYILSNLQKVTSNINEASSCFNNRFVSIVIKFTMSKENMGFFFQESILHILKSIKHEKTCSHYKATRWNKSISNQGHLAC